MKKQRKKIHLTCPHCQSKMVVDAASGEIVYTVRIVGDTFRPKVFREGSYTVKVGEQDGMMRVLTGLRPAGPEAAVSVEF